MMLRERIEEILRRVWWKGYVNQRNAPPPSLADDVGQILTDIREAAEEGMPLVEREYTLPLDLWTRGYNCGTEEQRQSDIKWLKEE